MKRIANRNWPLLLLLFIPALNVIYTHLNHDGAGVNDLMTDLDERIPFLPAFIIPYMLWYPYIFAMLVVFFIKDRSHYVRSFVIVILGLLASYATYSVFQTTVPRPELISDGFLTHLVSIVYAHDAPFNCFPSIHVLTSYIVMKAAFRSRLHPNAKRAVFFFSWTIIFSTLFVKQHAMLDGAGAIMLAELLFAFVNRLDAFLTNRRLGKGKVAHEL